MTAIIKLLPTGTVLPDEPLGRHTTYGIGGPAEVFARPANRQELADLLRFAFGEGIPVHFIGSGSNCLVSDAGVEGLVISLAGTLKTLQMDGGVIVAEAGVMLGHMVRRCLKERLTGMESLVGVPGTVGGALIMNAGAFGGEISTYLHHVRVLTLKGEEKIYRRADLVFSYRHSSFKPDEIIIDAEFHFPVGSADEISRRRSRASDERKARQPLKYRSAGSVFKNPTTDLAAGMLIDQAGLKGTRRGDAEISAKHANFILNRHRATAEDVAFLIKLAARTIKQQFGVQLELEIRTLGFPPQYWEEAGLGA